MWPKSYKDYPLDENLVKNRVRPGPKKSIIGCEMSEKNGWGNTLHHKKKKKNGFLGSLIHYFFGKI